MQANIKKYQRKWLVHVEQAASAKFNDLEEDVTWDVQRKDGSEQLIEL
jgi:hypothetical protein